MGWIAPLVVFVALALGSCFVVVQQKALWAEVQIARRERADHPDPDRRRKSIRSLVIVLTVYGSLVVAFYVGWRAGGTTAGAISAVCVALLWALAGALLAVKAAWVARK
jgi:hypothetical protein